MEQSNEAELLRGLFGKTKKASESIGGSDCIIYTRVSTKEQAETNLSLDTQKSHCEEYCRKNKLNVIGFFGGTYESAKTDGRAEFEKMLKFANKNTNNVGLIVVYSIDRFSRSGAHSLYIIDLLAKNNIYVQSASQPTNAKTKEGRLLQNMQLIFAQYDNELRTDKCITGMKERLKRGGWVASAPLGYEWISRNGISNIVQDSNSKYVKMAFEWRANGLNGEEIIRRFKIEYNFDILPQHLTRTFRNPLYCGYLQHSAVPGEIFKGTHEAIISVELFIRVNEILKDNRQGYTNKKKNPLFPFNRFLKDEKTNKSMSGYTGKKRLKDRTLFFYYYTIRCSEFPLNLKADTLYQMFVELIVKFRIADSLINDLRLKLKQVFLEMTESIRSQNSQIQNQLAEANLKISKLEEKYILDKIDDESYSRNIKELKERRQVLSKSFEDTRIEISNHDKFIEYGIQIASNLKELWVSGDYDTKVAVQRLAFPEGIYYVRETGQYRTNRINSVLELISSFTGGSQEKKFIEEQLETNQSPVVPQPLS